MLTVERQDTVQNQYGEQLDSWSELATRLGKVEPLNGREYMAASGEQADITTRIRFRYDATLAQTRPTDRIKAVDGRVFDIRSIIDPEEQHRELIFMCVGDAANDTRYP